MLPVEHIVTTMSIKKCHSGNVAFQVTNLELEMNLNTESSAIDFQLGKLFTHVYFPSKYFGVKYSVGRS